MNWQPIESAPKDGTYILVYEDDLQEVGMWQSIWVARWFEGAWYVHGCEYTAHDVTHWMPLPEPPK